MKNTNQYTAEIIVAEDDWRNYTTLDKDGKFPILDEKTKQIETNKFNDEYFEEMCKADADDAYYENCLCPYHFDEDLPY